MFNIPTSELKLIIRAYEQLYLVKPSGSQVKDIFKIREQNRQKAVEEDVEMNPKSSLI